MDASQTAFGIWAVAALSAFCLLLPATLVALRLADLLRRRIG